MRTWRGLLLWPTWARFLPWKASPSSSAPPLSCRRCPAGPCGSSCQLYVSPWSPSPACTMPAAFPATCRKRMDPRDGFWVGLVQGDSTQAFLGVHLTGRDKQCCASGSPELGSSCCLAQLLQREATNPSEYEFSFHLEIRGPCLLAGTGLPVMPTLIILLSFPCVGSSGPP